MRKQGLRDAKRFFQSTTAKLELRGGLLLPPYPMFVPLPLGVSHGCPHCQIPSSSFTMTRVSASWFFQSIFLWHPFSLSQLPSSPLYSLTSLSLFASALCAICGSITEGTYFLGSPCTTQYVVICILACFSHNEKQSKV